MKRIVSMLLALLLCASFALCASAETSKYGGVAADETVYAEGKDIIIGEVMDLCDGYTCAVIESRGENGEAEPLSITDKTKTKTFINHITDKDGKIVCTLQVVVKGMYSPTDRTSEITSLNYTCSEIDSSLMSISDNISGNTAELRLYYLGEYIGNFNYRISYNGNIEQS